MENDSKLIRVYCKKCDTEFSKDCATDGIHTIECDATEFELVKIFNGDHK